MLDVHKEDCENAVVAVLEGDCAIGDVVEQGAAGGKGRDSQPSGSC